MVLISRKRIPGKYIKANFLYHWGRITAEVFKKYLKSQQYFRSLVLRI